MKKHPDVFSSRYFRVDDPFIERFSLKPGLFRKPHFWDFDLRSSWRTLIMLSRKPRIWDFVKMQWWSRMYEYKWLHDCLREYFGKSISQKSALDAGCGSFHPGCFLLAQLGFRRADAQDVFEQHSLIDQVRPRNLRYVRRNLIEPIGQRYSAVCCISTLEHIPPDQQRQVMSNLCAAVEPGGVILLTVDMPGFEYDADLPLDREVLIEYDFEMNEVDVAPAQRLNSRNGRVCYPGWPHVGRDVCYIYRFFGVRISGETT